MARRESVSLRRSQRVLDGGLKEGVDHCKPPGTPGAGIGAVAYQRALAAGKPHDPYLEKKLEIKQ